MVLVHVNYVDDQDVGMIASAGSSVVHCGEVMLTSGIDHSLSEVPPRGVNVCLGTDSMASMPKGAGRLERLDLRSDMVAMANAPSLSDAAILEMATMLGRE